jgi:Icc-related predicted phosphoesterase
LVLSVVWVVCFLPGVLRVLHVSDVHCAAGRLERLLERESYDLVAATGDFECPEAARVLRASRAPVVAVTGNVDSWRVAEALEELGFLVDGRVVEAAGLRVAGVGGLDPHGDAERVAAAAGRRGVDVLLSHYPPRGVVDETYSGCRGGLEAVRRLAEALRPRLLLCGHIHEARGAAWLGETLVVNAGPLLEGSYAVVELPPEGRPRAILRRLG